MTCWWPLCGGRRVKVQSHTPLNRAGVAYLPAFPSIHLHIHSFIHSFAGHLLCARPSSQEGWILVGRKEKISRFIRQANNTITKIVKGLLEEELAMWGLHTHVCICAHACSSVYTCVCMCSSVCTRPCVCFVRECTCVCLCVCVCTYVACARVYLSVSVCRQV